MKPPKKPGEGRGGAGRDGDKPGTARGAFSGRSGPPGGKRNGADRRPGGGKPVDLNDPNARSGDRKPAGQQAADKPRAFNKPRPAGGTRPTGGQRPTGGDRPRGQAGPRMPRGMPGIEARRLAVDLVAGVQRGKLLDHLLDGGKLGERYQGLEPRDRGLVRAIVGTTLRRWGQIEDAIGRYLQRPLPEEATQLKAIMGVATAQLLFMDVPDHAAVSLAMDMASADRGSQPFKGVANAILRRIAREKDAILADQDPVALDTPHWMLERWNEIYGEDTARAIAASHLVEPTLDLSVKDDPEGWATRLGGIVLPTGSVRLMAQGAVEKLDGYDEGAWWVQDAAATLPVRLLGDVNGRKIADLCAAPGGKTAMLAHRGGDVTAVDVSYFRLERLRRNLHRLGLNAGIVTADIAEWMGGPFDMILLDAPCTATGTLRRHPDGALFKQPKDIVSLAALQRRLIDQAIRMLKPGGILVYSTCSLEPEEGPDQIRRLQLIDAPVERVPVSADEVFGLSEILTPEGDVRTLPTHLAHEDPRLAGMDGFFAARLRKRV